MSASHDHPPSPDILTFIYNGHPLRVTRLDGVFWYGSSGLARALGWVDSASIARCLGDAERLRLVRHKGRRLMLIDHPTMLEVAAHVGAPSAEPFLIWIAQVLRSHFGAEADALPARQGRAPLA